MKRRMGIPLAGLAAALGLAGATFGQGTDVDVVLDQFGVGGAYRPGDHVGVRLRLTARADSGLDQATPAWVQWDVPNADGDIAEHGRPLTLTKGQARTIWLYAPVPPDTLPGAVWPVRVFEYAEERRGRELGGLRISPSATGRSEITGALIGIVGPSQMGLGQVKLSPVGGRGLVHTAHEDTRAVFGLQPSDLPDRWEGLRCFEVIAWSGALPQDLGTAQADALREWVRRGGHLVISLPEDTNPWGLGEPGMTDLEDLLPTRAPRKVEEVPLSALLPVLSKQGSLGTAPDLVTSVRVFREVGGDFDATDNGYEPLVALPDGRVVAVQRTFGHGRITLLGLDLANANLTRTLPLPNGQLAGLPQADVLWNRILGWRADTPTVGELREIEAVGRLSRATPHEVVVGTDALFQEINMSSRAGSGLLLALLLFLVYWLLAGPGGFAILKQYKRVQHAWLAFAGAAGVFTTVAWAGVHVLRQNDVSVLHVTFLDHIARPDGGGASGNDPQLQRAVSWLSAYLPGYGSTAIGIESMTAEGAVPAQRDLLISWMPPANAPQKFPNADRYVVDVSRGPDDHRIPTRATSTQLYAHWLGGVDAGWGGLLRSDPADPIRVEIEADREVLKGSILNELPGPLRHVRIVWVWSRRVPARGYARIETREMAWVTPPRSGEMLNIGRMYGQTEIAQGASFAIPPDSPRTTLRENIRETYVRPFESTSPLGAPSGAALTEDERRRFMEMLSFYRQLNPPKYLKPVEGQDPATMVAVRMLGRELDLSAWLTRPCLIVVGYLEDSACPIPLRVSGEPVESDGTTVVRWIHPLPLQERIAFPPPAGQAAGHDVRGHEGEVASTAGRRRAGGEE